MELDLTAERGRRPRSSSTARAATSCNNTGYKGRMGIFELVLMNDDLRDLIVAEVSLDELRNACRKHGMRTLRESGLQAIYDGTDHDRGGRARDDDGSMMG